jgi:hypothetical protein
MWVLTYKTTVAIASTVSSELQDFSELVTITWGAGRC